jgi:hypothetical protein
VTDVVVRNVDVAVGRQSGREGGGDHASFASFLICQFSAALQGLRQMGAGVPSALLSFFDRAHRFGLQQSHTAHLSPTSAGCERKRRVRGGKYGGSESRLGGCAPR